LVNLEKVRFLCYDNLENVLKVNGESIMKRKIYQDLLNWKSEWAGRYALLINGARRVGKSYIVEEFARAEYKSYILLDFSKAPVEVKELFDQFLSDLDTFFLYLTNITGVKLYERETLIIFDEVQLFPQARAAVKHLVADGRYDYIETGSLISIKENVKDIVIPSEEQHIYMHPMDFEEFLWALGDDMLYPFIQDCYANMRPLGQVLHKKAMNYFRQYMVVGGMPQAVEAYVQTKDFEEVDMIKRSILKLYTNDINKHAQRYATKVRSIFEEIPSQLSKQDKKFKLASLRKGARMRDYEDALFWLSDSMIVNNCYNTTEPNIGLKLNMERITLKSYMADTGLLISHTFDEKGLVSEEIYRRLLTGRLDVNQGMLAENIVAQMLVSAGHKLFFYSNKAREDSESRMEIDFLLARSKIERRHNISPIEVKSGKRYTLSSIRKFQKKYEKYLHTAYVLHQKDLYVDEEIVYLPIYMTALLN